jgi:hypothetical protein
MGPSVEGRVSLGRMAWHEVRESGDRPSSAATRRVGMWVGACSDSRIAELNSVQFMLNNLNRRPRNPLQRNPCLGYTGSLFLYLPEGTFAKYVSLLTEWPKDPHMHACARVVFVEDVRGVEVMCVSDCVGVACDEAAGLVLFAPNKKVRKVGRVVGCDGLSSRRGVK